MAEFIYQEPFPLSEDTTEYRLLTKDYVKTVECDGRRILKVAPEGLELLAREAIADVSFYLRASHLQKLTRILDDPEATDNDKFVAYTMLLNQMVAAEGELPTCQDTGTAIVIGKKGEDVYTGCNDAEMLSKGIYETYRDRNLRYSQVVPFTMTEEKNTGTNLPAQIDLYAEQIQVYQEMEEEQYALFCQQVRSEEERGSLSYLSVLFKATSMADLLNRMEFVNEVAEYNKTLIAAMKETRENIKAEKTEMEAKEAQLGEQQDELQGKLDETTKLMNEYAADQRELEKLYAAEEEAGKAIVAEINRLMAESDVVPSAEGFIWPVTTSRKISSPQGNRVSPGNGIGSSNHKGVDICNVSYSSKIYATKSGKVLIASMPYSDPDGGKSGYGNYVVIDHGGGMSTLYAHMSIVKVSVGQYVTQGDVIGVTGNTGASTGPHLHYEVIHKGVPVNPINYFNRNMTPEEYERLMENMRETNFEKL